MIDEELYQRASDELNSERRQAHIWDRACALSKNDHDEARYLYTNLRVEEYIAELASGKSLPEEESKDDAPDTISAQESEDAEASSRTLPLDDTADFDSTLSIDEISSLSGDSDLEFEDDPLLQEIASVGAPLSAVEREYYEQHPDQLKELHQDGLKDPAADNSAELDRLLGGLNTTSHTEDDDDPSHALTAEFTEVSRTQAILNEDLDWLDDENQLEPVNQTQQGLQRFPQQEPMVDETDRLTQDLLRQADDLPGQEQHSDVVASDSTHQENSNWEPSWEPSNKANVAAVGTAAAIGAARYGNTTENGSSRRASSSADSAHLPLSLTDGKSGTEYLIFKKNKRVQAVKKGVSWSALLVTTPYLIYRQMFGTAIVYVLMSLIVCAGLIIMGLSWIDAGASASNMIKWVTAGFGLLAVVGLLYLPFRHGNTWRSNKLERRGFELVANVKAKNPGKAVAIARRASALD